jgi:hypothetical protein
MNKEFLIAAGVILVALVAMQYVGYILGIIVLLPTIAFAGYKVYKMIREFLGK